MARAPSQPDQIPTDATSGGDMPDDDAPLTGGTPADGASAEVAQRRQALSHLGGPIHLQGTPVSSEPLREALEGLELAPVDLLTHGFHTYPARLHPVLVRRLLERFADPGEVVLDPFTGGGTTPVEALVRGCQALGTDINPVALRIARVRTLRWSDDRIDRFVAAAQATSEAAFKDARQRVSHPFGAAALRQRSWYAPHVLLELQGLFDHIDNVEDPELREALLMVFSSIVVKVSRQASDSKVVVTDRQVGRGTASRLFGRKAEELGRRLRELQAAIPPETPRAILRQADARSLPGRNDTVDLIITSPPYAGTYDYSSHQDRRFDWLDEDPDFAWRHEIGARRHADDDGDGRGDRYDDRASRQRQSSPRDAWRDDEIAFLREMARVLKPGGRAFIVAGDGVLEGDPWFVDREINDTADAAGLRVMAIASQNRPSFSRKVDAAFRGRPRREHLIHLRKGGAR